MEGGDGSVHCGMEVETWRGKGFCCYRIHGRGYDGCLPPPHSSHCEIAGPGHYIRRCKICGNKLVVSLKDAQRPSRSICPAKIPRGMVACVPLGSSQHRSEHRRDDYGIFADLGFIARRCMVHQGSRKPHLYLPRDYARPNAMQRVTHQMRKQASKQNYKPYGRPLHAFSQEPLIFMAARIIIEKTIRHFDVCLRCNMQCTYAYSTSSTQVR